MRPGFVSNRVLMPLINEAAYCVMEGVASVEAVDAVMKTGMNHPIGPLEWRTLFGLDVCVDIMHVLQEGLGDPQIPCLPAAQKICKPPDGLVAKAGGASTLWGRESGAFGQAPNSICFLFASMYFAFRSFQQPPFFPSFRRKTRLEQHERLKAGDRERISRYRFNGGICVI